MPPPSNMAQHLAYRLRAIISAPERRSVGLLHHQNERRGNHATITIVTGLRRALHLVWPPVLSGIEVIVNLLFLALPQLRSSSPSHRVWSCSLQTLRSISGIFLPYTAFGFLWQLASCFRSMPMSASRLQHKSAAIDLTSQFLIIFYAKSTAKHVLKNIELFLSEEFEITTPTSSVQYDQLKKLLLLAVPSIPFVFFVIGFFLWLGSPSIASAIDDLDGTPSLTPVLALFVLGYGGESSVLRAIASAKKQLLA